MKKILTIFISIMITGCSTPNSIGNENSLSPRNGKAPTYCEQIVSVHGLLTMAQAQCGYTKYSNELINDSQKCMQHELGETYAKEILKFGMSEFERNLQENGKQKTCENILKEFPNYVNN